MKNYLGENLKRLREHDGMSVERVARMMEVDSVTVERWESGREKPDSENLALLARLFDVTVEDLYKVPENTTEQKPAVEQGTKASVNNNIETTNEKSDNNKNNYNQRNDNSRSGYGFESSPLASYLGKDENVLWFGQPTDEMVGGQQSVYLKIFSLLWIGFAIFWTVMATKIGGFFGVFGLLFLGVGFYAFFGKNAILRKNKSNLYYAVTDKRIMLCITGNMNRFRDIRYKRLNEVRLILSRRGTGCGTIVFSTPTLTPEYPYGRYNDRNTNTNNMLNSFIDIADAKRVYDLINSAKADYYDE